MKVIGTIDRCYARQKNIHIILSKKVSDLIINNKKSKWHYIERLKSRESYALKVEGGHMHPEYPKDFFACTIVVENTTQIQDAVGMLKKFFSVASQIPNEGIFTRKSPSSFEYDGLRLYARIKSNNKFPKKHETNILSKTLFEIQIKTFLQHAWDIAVHDLIYKGNEISWPTERIAYQIKAMLEHAEVSIHEIGAIKKSAMLNKQRREEKRLNDIKEFLTKNWCEDRLPVDMIRLSKNIYHLLSQLNVDLEQLQKLLDEEYKLGKGTKTLNLSPYFTIVQTIINQDRDTILTFLQSKKPQSKIPIPAEIEQKDIFAAQNTNIIRIGW